MSGSATPHAWGSIGDGAMAAGLVSQELEAALRRIEKPNDIRRVPNVPQYETKKPSMVSNDSYHDRYASAANPGVKFFTEGTRIFCRIRQEGTSAQPLQRLANFQCSGAQP